MSKIFLLFFVLYTIQLSAQTDYVYQVQLKDKVGTPFLISQPQDYLSPAAIARRQKYGVTIDSSDLPCSPIYIDSLLSFPGSSLHGSSRWLNKAYIITQDTLFPDFADTLNFVESTKLLGQYPFGYGLAREEPDNSGNNSGKNYNYGSAAAQMNINNGGLLHKNGFTGSSMKIAVIDNGFYGVDQFIYFDSLRNRNGIIGTYNFTTHSSNVYQMGSHGLGVLSIMASNIDGVLVGTAPDADYILITSEENTGERLTEVENLVLSMEFADSMGADLCSISLGYNTFEDPQNDFSKSQLDGKTVSASIAASMASSKGIMMVVSAGNEGGGSWDKILFPGDADTIITVGAVNLAGQILNFSGKGPTADGRIKPDVVSLGDKVAYVDGQGNVNLTQGTSSATPIIAGLTACLMPLRPDFSIYEWIQFIKQFSSRSLNPNNSYGWGIPNYGRMLSELLTVNNLENSHFNCKIYPNPSNGNFQIEIPDHYQELVSAKILDMKGSEIQEQSLERKAVQRLNFDLVSGNYLINIQTKVGSFFYPIRVD